MCLTVNIVQIFNILKIKIVKFLFGLDRLTDKVVKVSTFATLLENNIFLIRHPYKLQFFIRYFFLHTVFLYSLKFQKLKELPKGLPHWTPLDRTSGLEATANNLSSALNFFFYTNLHVLPSSHTTLNMYFSLPFT